MLAPNKYIRGTDFEFCENEKEHEKGEDDEDAACARLEGIEMGNQRTPCGEVLQAADEGYQTVADGQGCEEKGCSVVVDSETSLPRRRLERPCIVISWRISLHILNRGGRRVLLERREREFHTDKK